VAPWRKLNVLTVRVHPSNTRPHYLQRLGPEEGVFIRVGSTNRRAEETQIEELKRFNRMDSFDEQALPDQDSEAIDFRVASELFAPYRKLRPQDYKTLRITTEHQGRQVPTIGGLLLFGPDRLSRFPDAWIQAGGFGGDPVLAAPRGGRAVVGSDRGNSRSGNECGSPRGLLPTGSANPAGHI
jgi:predicted HTH transcriptional regulator